MDVALLGAGGYGTALLRPLIDNGHSIRLWDRDAALLEAIERERVNPRYAYLTELVLPGSVRPKRELAEAVDSADAVVVAVSIAGLPFVYDSLARVWRSGSPMTVVGITKGITAEGWLPDRLASRSLSGIPYRYAHLAGPAFARDLIRRAPIGLACASADPEAIACCRRLFGGPTVWIYSTEDLPGIEAAAAARTVLSFVFGGIAAVPDLERSTKAFVFARAQAEIARFGAAMGGLPATYAMDSPCAPATLGDLYLCDDSGSRNWRLGHRMTMGASMSEALRELDGVAESVPNAAVIHRIAERMRVERPDWELPWCEAVYRVCYEGMTIPVEIERIRDRYRRLTAESR